MSWRGPIYDRVHHLTYSVGHPRYALSADPEQPPRQRSTVGYALWVIIDALFAGIVLVGGFALVALVIIAGSREDGIGTNGVAALGVLSIAMLVAGFWLSGRLAARTYLRAVVLVGAVVLTACVWIIAALA